MSKRTFRLSDSRPDAKRDVEDEIAFHLEMRTREFMDQGLSAEDARRKAAASFGDVSSIRGDLSHERTGRNEERARREWWHGLRMDVTYSLRALRKNPAFAIAAIATLGLGFGAALAVFTVVNGVLVRPLPYKDPSQLAMVWMSEPNGTGGSYNLPVTSGFYADLERDSRSFAGLAAFRAWRYSLESGGTDAEPVVGARVTPSLFDVLGVRPLIGATFTKEDAVPGGPRVALISHALWQRRFGGDASLVGKQVMLSGQSFTVQGVMPPGFTFPRGAELPAGFRFGLRTEIWTPLVFDSTDLANYGTQNLSAVARYGAGGRQVGQSEASALIRRFLDANAPASKLDYRLVPLTEQAGTNVKRGLLILLGAVACLLVIACANVASLLVARATGRQRELAVRAALGAGRGRVARQLITENLVLAALGGLLGLVISYWGTKAMLALVPGSMPRADDIGLDWRVLSWAMFMVIAAGVVFGVATAFSVKWTRLAGELHSGGTRLAGGTHRWGRQALVSAEVALSLVLLIAAALLTRSFVNLQNVRPGFDATNVLTAEASLPLPGKFDPVANGPGWARTFNELTARLNASGGIVAGAISSLPLSGGVEGGGLRIPGRAPDPPGQGPHAQYNVVSGEYFRAARVTVISGRTFDASDDVPGATTIIVNREFVRKYFADQNTVVGRTVTPTFTFGSPSPHTIVGIVENVKQVSLDDSPYPQVYVPQSQLSYPGMTLVLRAEGNATDALTVLRRELKAVNPALSLNDIQTMDEVLSRSLARQRFSMTLIGVFAAAALALAIVGLYGVIALIVGQRRREIGVRLALGARPADVVRMIIVEGSRLSVAGVVVGMAASFGLTRILGALLYDVSATDAATFAAASITVILVSVAAALAPARRASHLDPRAALSAD